MVVRNSLSRLLGKNNIPKEKNERVQQIDINMIRPNPFQPRKIFDQMQLDELAKSIKEYGLIQPIIVRPAKDGYELVAGERRLRASISIGLERIAAIIRILEDRELAEQALIENLQREDLNYFEEAEGYKKLLSEFTITQEEIARRVGKSQSTIANKLRLLNLSERVKVNITPGVITERHARALLKLPDEESQIIALKEIYERELNVRETDLLIEQLLQEKEQEDKKRNSKKIVRIFKDMRIYINTIKSAVNAIENAGLAVTMSEKSYDDYIEVVIQIPKKQK